MRKETKHELKLEKYAERGQIFYKLWGNHDMGLILYPGHKIDHMIWVINGLEPFG